MLKAPVFRGLCICGIIAENPYASVGKMFSEGSVGMKELYSIGETADIMGVSVQTLRYYSKIGLLRPAHVNPQTGYRYYRVSQLHFIDRIKYLQKFGLNLREIKRILDTNDIDLLVGMLDKQERLFMKESERIRDIIDGIRWYREYFTYAGEGTPDSSCYSLTLKPRYLLVVECRSGEPKQEFHLRLNKLKSSAPFKELSFQRQFSYVLEAGAMLEGMLNPLYLGMFLKEPPGFTSPHVMEIPKGTFLCFKARILSEGWNPYYLKLFFEDKKKPSIVLANEYEDDLYEYSGCIYEVQALTDEA